MKINLLHLIDFDEVNKLLEGFNKSTGFVTAILDLDGNILSKSGWRQICTEFHRTNTKTSHNCSISDTALANKLNNSEKYHFYECLNGLVDVAVPIVIKGEHIANLFSGQFLFDEPNRDFYKKQAKANRFNEEKYLKALEKVPVMSKEKVIIAMDFLLGMTRLISEITLQKLEQIQLNEALIKSEERWRNTLDNILEGCQIIGFDWRYIYMNRSAEKHNRRPIDELIGRRYQDMWPGIEETEVFKIIEEVLEKRVLHHFENEFIFSDGTNGWFDLSIQPVPEGVFIMSIDITERKKAENALRESEEKYRLISENSDDWIYWVGPDGNMKYVSQACERVTGYSPEEFINNPNLNKEIILEPDRESFNQHSLVSKFDDSPHNLEFRIVAKDGMIRWISHSCSPIFDNNGDFLGRRGTNRNITEQKLREDQLYQSEFRFGKLFENSPFGMVVTNEKFRFVKSNPAFCSLLGYTEEELVKLTFADLTFPDELQENLLNIQKLIQKEISVYKTEKRYIRKDGQIIWGSLTVTANYAKDGSFLYNLAIVEDITGRKQAENKLMESEKNYRELFENMPAGFVLFEAVLNKKGTPVDLVIIAANEIFEATTGLKMQNAIGKRLTHVLPGIENDSANWLETYGKVALTGEQKQFEQNSELLGVFYSVNAYQSGTNRCAVTFVDITGRKKAEEEIRELNERIATATRAAKVGIWDWDIVNNKLTWDEQMYSLYGLKTDDFSGAFDAWLNELHPDDREFCMNETRLAIQGKKDYDIAFRVVWPDNSIRYIKARGKVFRNESGDPVRMLGVNFDITKQKQTEKSFKESEEYFRNIFEYSTIGKSITEFNGKNRTNRTFRNITGYSEEELSNLTWQQITFEDDIPGDTEKYDSILSGKFNSRRWEKRYVHKNGHIVWVDVSALLQRDSEGNPKYFITNIQDITDKKRAQEEIKKLNETLEERVENRTILLREANRELEAFSYSVSHDLRAPLRHINGFVDLLTERYKDELPEKAQHYLKTIVDASSQMGKLIDDLLEFSRTGRKEINQVKLDLNVMLEKSLELLNQDTDGRNISWKIAPLPTITGDQTLLQQVWVNLLSNAIKFTKAKNPANIQVGYKKEPKEHLFFVRDNGAGFDMAYSNKLFGVFQRLHSITEFEGTGIGLANVRRIIGKHGGRIWAESQINQGATFYFTLPKTK